jgi:hypothetical protein
MRITTGAPVTGDNFFPREAIVKKLVRALESEHVLFLAPRRTGKTSILLHLIDKMQVFTIFDDLEKYDHPSAWIKALATKLSETLDQKWQQKMKQAGQLLDRVKKIGSLEVSAADWRQHAVGLMQDLHEMDQEVWFFLDEFPTMIDKIATKHGKEEAEAVLSWLRSFRQENTHSKVRFLLTGSIGLDSVLRRHGMRGVANDLRRIALTPLNAGEGIDLARRLARGSGITLDESTASEFVSRLGPAIWPYFIQLFVAELEDDASADAQVESVYQAVAYGKHHKNQYADNMWDRLGDIFQGAEALTAREIMKRLSAADAGIDYTELRTQLPQLEDQDFNYVLDVLQHDGYLIEDDGGRFRFFSHLLRDYWRRRGRV